jgi:glyoxylase-like metal-dependent hydrolase (beta-lactamase superfamily II)
MVDSTVAEVPVLVKVSALDAGDLTLPERLFITDADPNKRNTVPSLSFLIQHPSPSPSRTQSAVTNLVFDLGIKRELDKYTTAQQAHNAQRQPIVTDPDCAASLRKGNLDPAADIDFVVLSHAHWDHIGTPSDFTAATFVVGAGTLDLLRNGAGPLYPAELFNNDELPTSRTVEFPPTLPDEFTVSDNSPKHTATPVDTHAVLPPAADRWTWSPLAGFPHVLDFFGDGSVYVIDSPGHLPGHVNLLVRTGERKYVYLGGDCCHDPRILRGETGIAMYDDGRGGLRSVHANTITARETLDRIERFVREQGRELGDVEVEAVVAHDGEWRSNNRHRFFPRTM